VQRTRQPEPIDSTRFQRQIGPTLDACRYEDTTFVITKHDRPFAVLMSIREWDRLQRVEEMLAELEREMCEAVDQTETGEAHGR